MTEQTKYCVRESQNFTRNRHALISANTLAAFWLKDDLFLHIGIDSIIHTIIIIMSKADISKSFLCHGLGHMHWMDYIIEGHSELIN